MHFGQLVREGVAAGTSAARAQQAGEVAGCGVDSLAERSGPSLGAEVVGAAYTPVGDTCGNPDNPQANQTCYLVPNSGTTGFGTLQRINALNGPRVLQFAVKWSF